MAWARVDDGWWCHPKVVRLSPAARGIWVSVLSWSCAQRCDLVPDAILRMVGGSNAEANELASAGLWDESDDGWVIHDWADYQDKSLSEKRAEAGRKGGQRSRPRKQAASNGEANAEAGALPVPSRPDPSSLISGDHPVPANIEQAARLALKLYSEVIARKHGADDIGRYAEAVAKGAAGDGTMQALRDLVAGGASAAEAVERLAARRLTATPPADPAVAEEARRRAHAAEEATAVKRAEITAPVVGDGLARIAEIRQRKASA